MKLTKEMIIGGAIISVTSLAIGAVIGAKKVAKEMPSQEEINEQVKKQQEEAKLLTRLENAMLLRERIIDRINNRLEAKEEPTAGFFNSTIKTKDIKRMLKRKDDEVLNEMIDWIDYSDDVLDDIYKDMPQELIDRINKTVEDINEEKTPDK
jgi:hypothetical protein